MSSRHPNVVNRDEVEPVHIEKGKHRIALRRLGGAAGAQKVGASLTEVPPGAISFPFHYHCAVEEGVFVVSGKGTARIGDAKVEVRAGDYIAYPIGPAHAHQMINDGTEPLVYLCISSAATAEVVGYPDSNKIGIRAGDSFEKPWIREIIRPGNSLEYFEGEPNA